MPAGVLPDVVELVEEHRLRDCWDRNRMRLVGGPRALAEDRPTPTQVRAAGERGREGADHLARLWESSVALAWTSENRRRAQSVKASARRADPVIASTVPSCE